MSDDNLSVSIGDLVHLHPDSHERFVLLCKEYKTEDEVHNIQRVWEAFMPDHSLLILLPGHELLVVDGESK